jgi:signal transduction histidine kinase
VTPVKGAPAAKSLWLVIFEELPSLSSASTRRVNSGARDVVRRLEAELRAAKTDQQSLVEQLERSNEDLKAANEEVTSMNEELQSTNEELQSSKEELQSMNEELSTVNAQLHEKVQELTTLNDDLTNLLTATDIATVFVDAEFRISRFTAAATRLLNLIPSDVGRPIGHVTTNLVGLDLTGEAKAVLRTLTPIEKAVEGRDHRHYIVRVLPYEREDKHAQGVVVTFVDVTTLKVSEQELRKSRHHAEEIAGLNQQALAGMALDALMTRCVNIAAEALQLDCVEVFEHEAAAGMLTSRATSGKPANARPTVAMADSGSPEGTALTTGQTVMMTGLQADARFAANSRVHERGLESGVVVIIRCNGELWGVLAAFSTAARVFQADEVHFLEALGNTLGTALTRARGERALQRLTETLEQRVAERTKWLTLTHDVTQFINEAATWDEAVRRIMRHLCETERWQVGYVYVADKEAPDTIVPAIVCSAEERFQPFHLASQTMRFTPGQSLPGLVYRDGKPMWVDDQEALLKVLPFRAEVAKQVGLRAAVAVPVTIGSETIAVLELLSDQSHPPSEDLLKLIINIATQIGKVVDRERLMGQVADMVWRDQQNLLHTLHDSLGQQLTGLGMLSSSLYQQFKAKDETAAKTAAQVSEQAKQALELVRQLSKGLFPVEIDSAGLTHALRQLASTTENLYKIPCRVEGDSAVLVHDNRIATELYRIAQEAVTNALKHADAHTISLRLSAEAGIITLRIADDGVGIGSRAANSAGMGLRIMRFRALSIGANVSVEPSATGGTVVTCTLREAPRTAAIPRAAR